MAGMAGMMKMKLEIPKTKLTVASTQLAGCAAGWLTGLALKILAAVDKGIQFSMP